MDEMVLEVSIGPCIRCGTPAADQDGGFLSDVTVKDGVASGTSVCLECMTLEEMEEMGQ